MKPNYFSHLTCYSGGSFYFFGIIYLFFLLFFGGIPDLYSQSCNSYTECLQQGDNFFNAQDFPNAAASYKRAQMFSNTQEIGDRLSNGYINCLKTANYYFELQMGTNSANPSFDQAVRYYYYAQEFLKSDIVSIQIAKIYQYIAFIQVSKNYLAQNQLDLALSNANQAYAIFSTQEALSLKNRSTAAQKVVMEVFFDERILNYYYDLSRATVNLVNAQNGTVAHQPYASRIRFNVSQGLYTVTLSNAVKKNQSPSAGDSNEPMRAAQSVETYQIADANNNPLRIPCQQSYNSIVVSNLVLRKW